MRLWSASAWVVDHMQPSEMSRCDVSSDYRAVNGPLPPPDKPATHAQLAHSLRQAHDRVTRLVHIVDELRQERAALKREITRLKRACKALAVDQ
jgi:hypothetical protein